MTTHNYHGRVLGDVMPGGLVRDVLLTMSSAVLVGLSAQAVIPLPFTPVPLSLATLTVLLSAAALGPLRAGMGMGLYLVAGVAGVPWFSQMNAGWNFPSFGYVIGFVIAGVLVGVRARRSGDRTFQRTVSTMLLGNAVIYVAGVGWLVPSLGVSLGDGLAMGVLPFLLGDAIKILFAAALLPATWRLVESSDPKGL